MTRATRFFPFFVAGALVSASACGRRVVPDEPVSYLHSVLAGCSDNTRVPDSSGAAKARNVRVRDVSLGPAVWIQACELNPESPAVWDAAKNAIAIENATLEFRVQAHGTVGLSFLLGAIVLIGWVQLFMW